MARYSIVVAVVFALLVVGANAQIKQASRFTGLPKTAETTEPEANAESGNSLEIQLQCEALGFPYYKACEDPLMANYYQLDGPDAYHSGEACPVTAMLVPEEEGYEIPYGRSARAVHGDDTCVDGAVQVFNQKRKPKNHDRSVQAATFSAFKFAGNSNAGDCRGKAKGPQAMCPGGSIIADISIGIENQGVEWKVNEVCMNEEKSDEKTCGAIPAYANKECDYPNYKASECQDIPIQEGVADSKFWLSMMTERGVAGDPVQHVCNGDTADKGFCHFKKVVLNADYPTRSVDLYGSEKNDFEDGVIVQIHSVFWDVNPKYCEGEKPDPELCPCNECEIKA